MVIRVKEDKNDILVILQFFVKGRLYLVVSPVIFSKGKKDPLNNKWSVINKPLTLN